MPVLSCYYRGKAKIEDGTEVELHPGQILQTKGPVIQIIIGVSESLSKALQHSGEKIPDPKAGHALIDTGASHSCIDLDFAAQLKLPIVDRQTMMTPSHSEHICPVYSGAYLEIIGAGRSPDNIKLLGASLKEQSINVLAGRDILANGILIYNGAEGLISFAI